MLVRDKIYIRTDTLGRSITGLCNLFTHSNPQYYKNKKLKFSCAGISPTLLHYKFENIDDQRYLLLPRGGLDRVKEFYLKNKIPLRILDERLVLPEIDCKLCPGVIVEEQQQRIIDTLIKNDGGLVQMDTAGGKCLGYGTKIIMYDGTIKEVQEIASGDLLMGDDSTARTVLSISKGNGKLCKVHQLRGDDFICNDVHILTLRYGKRYKTDTRFNKVIDVPISEYIKLSKRHKHLLKAFKVSLDFSEKNVLIDPYWLGCWLGDGNKKNTIIDNPEEEVAQYCEGYAKELNLNYNCKKDSREECNRLSISLKDRKLGNSLLNNLKIYNLIENKHIPMDYKINSRRIRLELLAGICDTDGYSHKDKSCIEITFKKSKLVEDVAFLARSLGFHCSINIKKPPKEYSDNEYCRLHITGNLLEIPMRVVRKLPLIRKMKKDPLVTGFTIEKMGMGDYYGFTLDGNGRFLLEDFTVTHNTIGALAYIAKVKQPTLILLHKHILKDQWMSNIKKILTGSFIIGEYSEGMLQHGDVVVGLVQTIHTLIDKGETFLDRFGAVIIDECLDTETLINTPGGLERLKNVKVGSVVLTPRGTCAKVTHVKKVRKEAFKYNISGGGFIIASKDHKVPTLDNSRNIHMVPIGSCNHILFVKRPNVIASIQDIEFMDKRLYESRTVLSVESLGERELIDITIDDPEHLFVANGIAVSNCHHVSADTYLKVVNNMAAKYKVGLTATVKRKDQKDILIYDVLGPILLQIDAGEIKHRVTAFEYRMVNSNVTMEMPVRKRWTGRMKENMPDPTMLVSALIANIERNDLIINSTIEIIEKGYFPLILSDRRDHCKFLTDELTSKGYNTKLVIGDKQSKKNKELEVLQTDTSIQAIVATMTKAYEGLDIGRLSALVLTCPSSNLPNLKQKLGRIRRHVEGKPLPIVLDIVDNLVYMEEISEEGEKVVKYPLLYSSYGRIKYYNKLLKEYNSSL